MKILLATDGSELAEDAGRFLAHLPHTQKLDLVVLSVVLDLHLHGTHAAIEWLKENQEAEKVKSGQACDRIADMFDGANVNVERVTCQGHVGRQIVQTAKERQVDLIVVGAVGHSMIGRILLGSVSDFVATHADCSVLVVRPSTPVKRIAKNLNICVAHDDSEPSRFAITQLGEFCWQRHTKLQVLNVLNLPFTYMNEPIEVDLQPVRDAMQLSLKEATDALEKFCPDVDSELIEASHVGDAIVGFAEQNRSDLIVLGNTGLGLIGRFLLGSVANYVLRHATCSVWIARDRNPTHS